MGPMVGLIGAILTYMAFYEQYKANKMIADRQREEDFVKLFEMYLREFRFSVDEWKIPEGISGKICSHYWISEYYALINLFCSLAPEFITESSKNRIAYNGYCKNMVMYIMLENRYAVSDTSDWITLEDFDFDAFIDKVYDIMDGIDDQIGDIKVITERRLNFGELSQLLRGTYYVVEHRFFQSGFSSLKNSLLLLDSLMELVFLRAERANVNSVGMKRVVAGLLYGDLAQLYLHYQESRFGSPLLLPFVKAIQEKRYDELEKID